MHPTAHERAGSPVVPVPPSHAPQPPDLFHALFGGAKRPHGPARTPGAAKPRREAHGPGRRTPGRPRSGAAEAATTTPGSGVEPGGQPEPTTSCLPWFALRPLRAALPHKPLVGCNPRHSNRELSPLALRPPFRPGSHCPLVRTAVTPSSVIHAGSARPTLLSPLDYKSQRSFRPGQCSPGQPAAVLSSGTCSLNSKDLKSKNSGCKIPDSSEGRVKLMNNPRTNGSFQHFGVFLTSLFPRQLSHITYGITRRRV